MSRRPVLLALRASGLGDLLTVVPALRALARAFPDHVHALAAPPALWPIASLTGAVDVLLPVSGLHERALLARGLDVAVDLHGAGPESHRLLLESEPAQLLAFAHPEVPASHGGPRWRDDEHDVDRWSRLLAAWDIACDPHELDLDPPSGRAPAGARAATVLHPGAGAPARRWPLERWSALARAELAEGHRVAITAGPGERPLADEIREHCGSRASVVDTDGDVAVLARAVAAAGRVVCGDTGVAHLATALRTPSVVLCGPTPPSRWGPPPDRSWHVALWAGSGPGDPHAPTPDRALLELEVADVLLALRSLPARAT